MALAASLPYGIVRFALLPLEQSLNLGLVAMLLALVNLLALLYWCQPALRRGGPL